MGDERAVLVTTEHRGVFFGYTDQASADVIRTKQVTLKRARNCIYWPASNHGFLGLAAEGPHKGSRIGPPADIELGAVTCIAEVSENAIAEWEKAPWRA